MPRGAAWTLAALPINSSSSVVGYVVSDVARITPFRFAFQRITPKDVVTVVVAVVEHNLADKGSHSGGRYVRSVSLQ